MQEVSTGPLSGVRVLDASIMAAGPWTAALLGKLGAEVIKIEPPDGDGTRWVEPTQRGMGTNFMSMNVNKKDITLDLKSPQGRAAALALAADSDVFVQNFRVGVIERLGLDYDAMRAVNPRLVYCAISGFGERGPLHKAGCADYIMQAFSGFARSNGAKGDELEAFRFTGFLDLTTASVAAESVLAALLEREFSGQGQKVEVSMLEAALEIQATRVAELLGGGLVPRPLGSESAGLVPDSAFATLDNEIFVTVQDASQWQAFCAAIARPELAGDGRFSSNAARVAHRAELYALLLPVFKARPALWWLRSFERHGVPCGIAHHFETFRYHQQVVANEMIANIDTAEWGMVSVAGVPWHFAATPGTVKPPPRPGEHTEAVLGRLATPCPGEES